MSLLSARQLSCTQGSKLLFENISFAISAEDKIALVGLNGCGKSSLLSIITEAIEESRPEFIIQQGLRVRFLPQQLSFDPDSTIHEHLFENREIEAWDYEARVQSILRELQIVDLDQKMKQLSGGMLKKIGLAEIFSLETDLLILDEPTNHLDIETIDWLEKMLGRMDAALLMVTHDRYFLDKICTRIFEIDQKSLFVVDGNYSQFLLQRAMRYEMLQKADQTLSSILRVELEWLKRGPKARSTKQKARKQRIDEMVNQDRLTEGPTLELGVAGRRLGKKILELKHVTKSFEDRPCLRDFSYSFKEGEKIGILGPNGVGKTTLLNLISGRLVPDSGEIDAGVNTAFGYFDQHSQDLDLDDTVLEHVSQFGRFITMHDGTELSATKLLERFLFPASSLRSQIGRLSGGERRRLDLVCTLLANPNFLLFDEPTNDLDITTLSILEDFLLNFGGCVLVISHDRYFLDRVVDHLFIFEGRGKVTRFWGTYSDFVEAGGVAPVLASEANARSVSVPVPTPVIAKNTLTNREREELKRLEKEIDHLETEKKTLSDVFTQGGGSAEVFAAAGKRLAEISELLEQTMLRWEDLAQRS